MIIVVQIVVQVTVCFASDIEIVKQANARMLSFMVPM
jgi:hypothetical protein